jgi:hypothetical protein
MEKQILLWWLSALVVTGTCWARQDSPPDEMPQMLADSGVTVALFDHGKLSMANLGSPNADWTEAEIPGAIGHSWSDEGMVSPDGTLVAFPYWEVDPCPSVKACDVEADRHYFLAIAHRYGVDVWKFPQIILPAEMCWSRDDSKLAMIAQPEDSPRRELIVLHLDSERTERVGDGKTAAVTPQCWSPDGRQLVFFVGDKSPAGPGAIRIMDLVTGKSRDIFHGGPDCTGNIMCASPYPTWSPDGRWIAYFQRKSYWAIQPSGVGKKKLFRRGSALSPLQWSPDMRYALYADCCAFRDTWRCMCEIGRIRVRRLADNDEFAISSDGYQDMYIPRWTWIQLQR